MTWNLFIDDERYPSDTDGIDWDIARNIAQVRKLVSLKGMPQHISFDHDLGKDEPTGYDIVKWLVELDMDGSYHFGKDFSFYVHSQNLVGKKNIEAYLENYFKIRTVVPMFEAHYESYDDGYGIRIFENKDSGVLAAQEGRYSCMDSGEDPFWGKIQEISLDDAIDLMCKWTRIEEENKLY